MTQSRYATMPALPCKVVEVAVVLARWAICRIRGGGWRYGDSGPGGPVMRIYARPRCPKDLSPLFPYEKGKWSSRPVQPSCRNLYIFSGSRYAVWRGVECPLLPLRPVPARVSGSLNI